MNNIENYMIVVRVRAGNVNDLNNLRRNKTRVAGQKQSGEGRKIRIKTVMLRI